MTSFLPRTAILALALLLAGCAIHKIDSGKFSPPRTVVIEDVPDITPIVLLMRPFPLPAPFYYFSERTDHYYTGANSPGRVEVSVAFTTPVRMGTAVGAGVAGGLVGAMINQVAADSARKAEAFPDLARGVLKDGDLRSSLMTALRASLEAKGIEVRIDPATRDAPRRPRWNVKAAFGTEVRGARPESPPVDADLLVQLAPIASYSAHGLALPYERRVGVAVALFHGRTREFIGWQAFAFEATSRDFEYSTYDKLAADVEKAAPALRTALLSLVPEIAEIISGKRAH